MASCVPPICATAPGLERLTTTPTLLMLGTSWTKVPTSLALKIGRDVAVAGDVPARLRQARHEPHADRVGNLHHDDGNGQCRAARGNDGRRRPRDNDINIVAK